MDTAVPTILKDKAGLEIVIDNFRDKIATVLDKDFNPDRFIVLARQATLQNPSLLNCSTMSWLGAIFACATLRLEPDPIQGHAYLIPYKTKNGWVVNFQIGYKGFTELAYRDDRVLSIYAHCVYKGDTFEISQGTNPEIIHKVNPEGLMLDKDVIGAYAVLIFKSGEKVFEYMPKAKIEKVKQVSQTDKIWGKWYAEMSKKTVIKSLLKTQARQTNKLNTAIQYDSVAQTGGHLAYDNDNLNVIDGEAVDNDDILKQLEEAIDNLDIEDNKAIILLKNRISKFVKHTNPDQQVIDDLNNKLNIKLSQNANSEPIN